MIIGKIANMMQSEKTVLMPSSITEKDDLTEADENVGDLDYK